jgi:hypothetical protein
MKNLRFIFFDGERTPLACGFRRRAENLLRMDDTRAKGLGATPKPTRGTRVIPETK